jgi:hypothetical protein
MNILIENPGTDVRENISSIIIGDNNWAGAWAGISAQGRAQELALRSGVNMVMYAIMGNYKSDQLQIDQILKKLGR